VPSKAEIINAWQKRQDKIASFQFAWAEEQCHRRGWLPNPRYPEREWLAIPALRIDRTYAVTKSLAVDGNRMRYTFDLDGIRSRTRLYNILYPVVYPLLLIANLIRPASVTTTERVGQAMLHVARNGFPKKILENPDINVAAGKS
jgi:hypothetical protein